MSISSEQPSWIAEYRALLNGIGLVDVSDRTLVEISGDDRASFLHNFCTNEIRKLPEGVGCEAFLTSVQGKTLGHVFVFSGSRSLILETVPGQGLKIVEHLDRYVIREKVSIVDRSGELGELFLAGPGSEAALSELTGDPLPAGRLSSIEADLAASINSKVWIRRVDWIQSAGFLIECRRENMPAIVKSLVDAGAVACSRSALEAGRIEAGTPLFGQDITDKNLPQEIARDRQAISFTKGCYLGQETVARLDALGHVNRLLAGVRFEGERVPPPGTELMAGDERAGDVTSATFSPALAAPLALAFVRSGKDIVGTRLHSSFGAAEVVTLPVDRARG